MNPFMLISAFVVSYLCVVQGQSRCTTPTNSQGICIELGSCDELSSILHKGERTQEDIDLLRRSHCGFEGQSPKVCCAIKTPTSQDCSTPRGEQGECIDLYQCPSLIELITPRPLSKETVAYVQNSKCDGPYTYSVCCPFEKPVEQQTDAGSWGEKCEPSYQLPDPNSKCCGRDVSYDDRIIGGGPANIDQYPWLTLIEYVKGTKIRLLCGGSLISGKYVLTAGHCLVGQVLELGKPKNVRLSEYDITNDVIEKDCAAAIGGGTDCTPGVVVIPIAKTIPHPEYNPRAPLKRHDIGLIKLTSLAPFTEFVRPICLPLTDVTAEIPNVRLWVAGWGAVNSTVNKSDLKLHVDLPYVSNAQCQPSYSVPRRNIALWKGQMCAGGEKDRDSCKGDSGGPLMYDGGQTTKRFDLIGVVSFGPTPCGMENVPGVYTKVYEYMPWIRQNMTP